MFIIINDKIVINGPVFLIFAGVSYLNAAKRTEEVATTTIILKTCRGFFIFRFKKKTKPLQVFKSGMGQLDHQDSESEKIFAIRALFLFADAQEIKQVKSKDKKINLLNKI